MVAAFSEVPSLSVESELAIEVARALEGWCEVDVVAPMLDATAHLEAFHGGRLHRVSVAGTEDVHGAADAFERALDRQIASARYDAVHLLSPLGAGVAAGRTGGDVPIVAHVQPLPALGFRFGPAERGWLERLAAEEAATLDAASLLILHEPADTGALRFRRRLAPHLVLPEPVDVDAYHWEQLVPGPSPVVLILDPAFPPTQRFEMLQPLGALERSPGVSTWRLSVPSGRLQPGMAEPETGVAAWAGGTSKGEVRLKIAARTAFAAADVVIAPHAAGLEECGLAASCRRWGILQSAACRRPLVVSDSQRFPLPADLAENVFRFPAGDWAAMAQIVRSVLLHPAKAAHVADRAWKRVHEAHSATDFRRRLRAIYAGILGHDPTRPGPMPVRVGPPEPETPEAA
ncbi:MAG: hypothetical protein QME96_13340 [Myxococcota bacterium]|nr:hypothetical protein [Myxococcota bacterium]